MQLPEKHKTVFTFLILLSTFGEDVLCSCVDAVSVEIVRLEKAGPELLLRHVVRHIFIVLLLDCTLNEKNRNYTRLLFSFRIH